MGMLPWQLSTALLAARAVLFHPALGACLVEATLWGSIRRRGFHASHLAACAWVELVGPLIAFPGLSDAPLRFQE